MLPKCNTKAFVLSAIDQRLSVVRLPINVESVASVFTNDPKKRYIKYRVMFDHANTLGR